MSRRSPLLNGKGSSSTHRPDCFGPFSVRADASASRIGPVYLGHDPSTNGRVVIRTFELSRESRERGALSDLLDSLRTLCETTLDHASLARPLAFGAEGDIPYLVYADLAGTTMDAVMRQDGPRLLAEVLHRTTQLADAIDCAASAGVHHGMLAPCDVILDGERTGITGYGIAQALIKAGIPSVGEPPYGSPQRISGAPPTRADDVHSLAAIALELLIGTPKDPDQEARALREAQGLPDRRRLPRPAPHETRLFTTIAGVDAGKLRAAFAAAFSEEPDARPSTAAEFVAQFQDAISNKRMTEEASTSVMTVPSVRSVTEERKQPPPDPVPVKAPAEATIPEAPGPQERVVVEGSSAHRRRGRARRRQKLATSPSIVRESLEHEPRDRKPETQPDRSEPNVGVSSPTAVASSRGSARHDAAHEMPAQSGSRAFLVAAGVVISFSAGFGGGFVAGHFSRPSTTPIEVGRGEPAAEPRPTRAAGDDPTPVASTAPAVAAASQDKVSSTEPSAAPVPSERAVPAVAAGRLLVRSTPAGAGVVLDGQSRGVTPVALAELTFGPHTVEVSHPGHGTRRQRITLSERRPERSLAFELRPTIEPAPATAAPNSAGSLHVTSQPSGASVFLDDDLIGTTPLLLSGVTPGSRRLRVESPGYKVWTKSVQIEPGARSRVSASLEP